MNNFNTRLSYRYFLKNKKYSVINIIGLTLGIATFCILSYFIYYNLSFDRFRDNYRQIYRIDQKLTVSGQADVYSCVPFPFSKILAAEFPEIIQATRVRNCREYISVDKEHTYYEPEGLIVDSNFFEVFEYEFVKGSPATALNRPDAILLSEKLALKYFADQNPIGKTLYFEAGLPCTVTAVYKDPPGNSLMTSNYILNFPILKKTISAQIDTNWDWCMSSTYVMLHDSVNPVLLGKRITKVLPNYWHYSNYRDIVLWPLKNIRMQYSEYFDSRPVFILFGTIALLVLIVACINYTNLSVTYSISRLREITLKKAYGASKMAIIRMFLMESFLFTAVALIFAFAVAEITIPLLNKLMGFNLDHIKWNFPYFILAIIGTTFLSALISGIYPGLMLASSSIATNLKSNSAVTNKSPLIHKILVIIQFIVSIALITGTAISFEQMKYMKELNLGLTQEKILIGYFQLQEPNNIEKYNVLKLDLLKNPAIDAVSWSHNAPFFRQEWWDINIEGEPTNKKYHLQHNHIDSNFIKTYGIKILIGHSLSSKLATDTIKYCLINDNASHLFGWGDSAVGKIIYNNSDPYEVVGIMNDFYINSISRPVEPCFFSYSDRDLSWPNTHSIRIKRGYDVNTMNKWVTKKFRAYFPNSNLEFTDYDEIKSRVNFSFIDILYNLVSGFSIIALIIASLGLYGLVSFISRKRTKEIGVRKVNGAYTFDIYKLMVKEFIIMLLIAYVLALPLIYFISNKIIVNFANHTKVGIGIYVFALIVSLAITLITISIEIIKASHTNPVDSLRYE